MDRGQEVFQQELADYREKFPPPKPAVPKKASPVLEKEQDEVGTKEKDDVSNKEKEQGDVSTKEKDDVSNKEKAQGDVSTKEKEKKEKDSAKEKEKKEKDSGKEKKKEKDGGKEKKKEKDSGKEKEKKEKDSGKEKEKKDKDSAKEKKKEKDSAKEKEKKEKDSAKEKEKNHKEKECAAGAEKSGPSNGHASSEAGGQAAKASEAPNAGSAPADDLSGMFLPVLPEGDKAVCETQKAAYLASDLIVSGVALKKFKQAFEEMQHQSHSFFGLLGLGSITMHRVTKACTEKMIFGNMRSHGDIFWEKACQHLDPLKVSAFVVPENSDLVLPEARCAWD